MRKIAFITAEDAEPGFAITGVSQHTAGKQDMMDALKKVTSDPVTGLVIIDERLLSKDSEEEIKHIEQTWKGILLVLPSPEKAEVEIEDYATRLIRKAIGYHVRLQI